MPATFNPETGKYEEERGDDAGAIIGRSELLEWVDESIQFSDSMMGRLASSLNRGTLTPAKWREQMENEIERSFIGLYLLGRGGVSQLSADDWQMVAALIDRQGNFLNNFYSEVTSGVLSDEQIKARARLYANAARQAFERGLSSVARSIGADEEAWVLRPVRTQHCEDCISLSGKGFQPIGSMPFPGDGSTACRSNCKCYKIYRNSESGKTVL